MDRIFKALGDPSRRALLDALKTKDGQTLSELEAQLRLSRFGVMKHLGVLEEAGLITTIKRGRFKHHYLNALPLQEVIDRWIDPLIVKPMAREVIDLKAKLEGKTPMFDGPEQEKPDFVLSTYIKCSQDALWDALRDPNAVQHYHFMAAKAEMRDGKMVMLMDDGTALMSSMVISETPKTRIETTFEPHWDPKATISQVVYTIAPEGDTCRLTIEHYGLKHGPNGVGDGWTRWASGLKTWLETGQDAHFGSRANKTAL